MSARPARPRARQAGYALVALMVAVTSSYAFSHRNNVLAGQACR